MSLSLELQRYLKIRRTLGYDLSWILRVSKSTYSAVSNTTKVKLPIEGIICCFTMLQNYLFYSTISNCSPDLLRSFFLRDSPVSSNLCAL